FATEPGDASGTAYFDVRTRRYRDEVLAAIDDRRDWVATLPRLVPSLDVIGTLRPEAADALGLAAGIAVSAGGGGNMCAGVGGAGVFVGLRANHGRASIVRAVVEGVTFGLAYALEALRRTGVTPTEVTLVGGGASSDAWAQLCADLFDLPVVRPAIDEAAASGAARQAQWVVEGARPSLAPAASRRFEPRPRPELHAAAGRMAALRELA